MNNSNILTESDYRFKTKNPRSKSPQESSMNRRYRLSTGTDGEDPEFIGMKKSASEYEEIIENLSTKVCSQNATISNLESKIRFLEVGKQPM